MNKHVVMPLFMLLSISTLGACATGSPDYVGSISPTPTVKKEQRMLDNGQINSIIKSLQSEADKQKEIIKTIVK